MYATSGGNFRVMPCNNNNYGTSFFFKPGLQSSPCIQCPSATEIVFPGASVFWRKGQEAAAGTPGLPFIGIHACQVKPGFGGEDADTIVQCPVGTYGSGGFIHTSKCVPCPIGVTTSGPGKTSYADCTVAMPGYGSGGPGAGVRPCQMDTYSLNGSCAACPGNRGTSGVGAASAAECDICADGYGVSAEIDLPDGTSCDACSSGTYGSRGERGPGGQPCTPCPVSAYGFRFDYGDSWHEYVPAAVSPPASRASHQCLSEYAQIGEYHWYLSGADKNVSFNPPQANGTAEHCALECSKRANCHFFTWDYAKAETDGGNDQACKVFTPPDGNAMMLAYKNLQSSTVGPASFRAKSWYGQGVYTVWNVTSETTPPGIAMNSGNPVESIQQCLAACDSTPECALVAMGRAPGVDHRSNSITSCTMMQGDAAPGENGAKRSMTRAVVTDPNRLFFVEW